MRSSHSHIYPQTKSTRRHSIKLSVTYRDGAPLSDRKVQKRAQPFYVSPKTLEGSPNLSEMSFETCGKILKKIFFLGERDARSSHVTGSKMLDFCPE